MSTEGGEKHEPLSAVLRLHHTATLQGAVEATVDVHCKTVCFNLLFGDVNILIIALSKKDNFFLNVSLFVSLA